MTELIIKLIQCEVCKYPKDNVAKNHYRSKKYMTVCNTCKDQISRDPNHELFKSKKIKWQER